MRTTILSRVILLVFVLLVLNLFYVQIIRGSYFYRLSVNNSTRVVSVEGPRGRILDRNGKMLAESRMSYDVAVIPQDIGRDKKPLFRFLARVLDADSGELEKRYHKNRLTPFTPVVVARGVSREKAIVIEENSFLYPGLVVRESWGRSYPQRETGAHILGYVGKVDETRMERFASYGYAVPELVGYTGIEEFYDEHLRGGRGGREIEVNSRGQQVRLISMEEPSPGKDIVLTIDQRMQSAAHDALAGRRGALVILDPVSGEVLVMASSPSYDPNLFVDAEERWRVGAWLRDEAAPLLNRAIAGQYPPGSVFKIPVAIAGLEEKKITPRTSFECPGFFELGDRRYQFPHGFGVQDLTEAMAHSANEYFFHTALLLSSEILGHYARLLGLGEKTGIDLPYEVSGAVPAKRKGRKWFTGDTLNMSIGQGGLLATPLQLAAMLAALENKGVFVKPRVVKTIGGIETVNPKNPDDKKRGFPFGFGQGREAVFSTGGRRMALRKDTWQAVSRSLRAVVTMGSGTGNPLNLPGMETYGKTGTAQTGGGREDHAWFAGVTKTEKRTIAYCAFLEHGGSSHNAVLMLRDLLQRLKEEGLI